MCVRVRVRFSVLVSSMVDSGFGGFPLSDAVLPEALGGVPPLLVLFPGPQKALEGVQRARILQEPLDRERKGEI